MDISKIAANSKLDNNSPRYLQIAKIIISGIQDGSFLQGSKLPAERELASLFGVSRTTAINTYRYLEQQGLVNSKKGSGTFVAKKKFTANAGKHEIPWNQIFRPYTQTSMSSLMNELLSNPLTKDTISLDAGMPNPKFYPLERFKKIFRTIDFSKAKYFGHIPIEGLQLLRESIANLLRENCIQASFNNILVTSGSQQGIYLISKVFIEPGDYVIVESPTYIGAIQVLQAAGAKILSLPVEKGLSLNILEDYLVRYRPKFFYTIPTYQNPTGKVMSFVERKQLLEMAARHRLIIVEDDPYSEFYYEEKPPLPIKALNGYEGCIYLSTFSKMLMPGLRLGYIAAHPSLINRITMEKQYIDLHSNNFSQWLLFHYLSDNNLKEHLSLVRKEYKTRRDILHSELKQLINGDLEVYLPSGGFYLWCKILFNCTSRKLLQEALKTGISFVPGDAFDISSGNKEFRLCFTSNDADALQEAVKRLHQAITNVKKNNSSTSNIDVKPLI
ncbi:MAG: PLP-dependent aminotransferase family protein [Bacillota bacterium]